MSRTKRWLFRLVAVLLGLAPLAAFEGLCVLMDWGDTQTHDDPFVGFRSVRPLFVLDESQTRWEVPPSRQTYFRPESFAAAKPAEEFRIFCLGGSTVQGRPFGIETSLTTWLELALQQAKPERRWEVINCGGVSYASYRLIPILEEVLRHQPDLIILYTGHNEFLEQRSLEHIADRGELVNVSLERASRLRTFNLLREGYLNLQGQSSTAPPDARPILPTEVDALLDYRGGLEEYQRDDAWRRGVIAQYEFNLCRMVKMARDAGVPMLLVNPVSNLRDCPPFKSLHRGDITPEELAEWESLCTAAREHLQAENYDAYAAAEHYQRACEIDPQHAGGHYNLAQCYETIGQTEQARAAYLKAKDLDICPLRILQPMNEAVLTIARQTRTPVFDADQFFTDRSECGIAGSDWLLDHVHPGIKGHQQMGLALVDEMSAMGIVEPREDWRNDADARFGEHLASLEEMYFLSGSRRLNAVRNWANGRATRLRTPESDSPETDDP